MDGSFENLKSKENFGRDRVKSLKLGYYGHTTRKYESLEKELIQGCTPETEAVGL